MRLPLAGFRYVVALAAAGMLAACTQDLPTDTNDELSLRAAKGGNTAGGGTKPASGVVVGATMPSAAKRSTTLDVRILGSGFDRNMSARWAIDSVVTSQVAVNSTRYVSSTELVANITVTADAPLTEYDIIITSSKGGKGGIGTELFEVVEELPLVGLGGANSLAFASNEAGQIAGFATQYVPGGSGGDRPVVWENGIIRNLLPAGYHSGRAIDINERGEVVGWLFSNAGIVPFLWSASAGMRILPYPAGEGTNVAMAINDNGLIVGYSGRDAVMWENGEMKVIHTLAGHWSYAPDVNNSGEVVGAFGVDFANGPFKAFTWTAAAGVQLMPTLYENWGEPIAINDRGQIVGNGRLSSDAAAHGFIRENGVTRRLSTTLQGAGASAISELGHIVGSDALGRGILWEPGGTEVVLCQPVPPAKGYTSRCTPYGVTSAGQAVGMKPDKYGQTYKAYLWSLVF